jgi:hypothetical protein
MTLGQHGRAAQEYWQLYRPKALAELGSPQEQETYFHALDLRVMERIADETETLLAQVPMENRAGQRQAIRMQAKEIVYNQEIYLEKEPGTEHREM